MWPLKRIKKNNMTNLGILFICIVCFLTIHGKPSMVRASEEDVAHKTHLHGIEYPRGPGLIPGDCSACHPGGSPPDSTNIDYQQCIPCHSPDGDYNGFESINGSIGAKDNWIKNGSESAIYDENGNLKPGKEKWCVGCHDNGASNINGIGASNVAGMNLNGDLQMPLSMAAGCTNMQGTQYLIDGDTSTGNTPWGGGYFILDMGDAPPLLSHLHMYISSGGTEYFFQIFVGDNVTNCSDAAWGTLVGGGVFGWSVGKEGEGWYQTRMDIFMAKRYIKVMRIRGGPIGNKVIREVRFKSNIKYGYYLTGHKISCDNCHDLSTTHIDGLARTYSASGNNYHTGYRLKSVEINGEIVSPMEIPRIGCNSGDYPKNDDDFALCFTCHNKYKLLGDASSSGDFFQSLLKTNFRYDGHPDSLGNPVNAHIRHLRGRGGCGNTPDWDSDWDNIADSPQSCPSCHNIHGSPTPAMTRHGDLASTPGTLDKVPMLSLKYISKVSQKIDPDLTNVKDSIGGETFFWGGGPGTLAKNHTCNMCHNDKYTYYRAPVASPIADCKECHNAMESHPSHATHLEADPRGPALACTVCHADGSVASPHLKLFADGKPLTETTSCDICHSPDGAFDGSNDSVIGAKTNWVDGVYDPDTDRSDLKEGLENWCAGCHDNGTSICDGVIAPNVMGDNATYGYNITGHKITCSACHDLATTHLDCDSRTYNHNSDPWNLADPHNYQNGYRLKGSMIIPLGVGPQGGYAENRFALCFECHNYSQIVGETSPYMTNFQDDGINRHAYHLKSGRAAWDSDWDYQPSSFDYSTLDSRMSCPACHNVHGAPNPVMIRHGELISTPPYTQDKVPALDFHWYKEDGYTITIFGTESHYSDMSVLGGPGGGTIEDCKVCVGCHGGPYSIKYDRIYQEITMPIGSWARPPLPPSVRFLNPQDESQHIEKDRTLSFMLLSNDQDPLVWTTFSISLEGNKSYAKIYTDEDPGVVLKEEGTATSHIYHVTIIPDAYFGDQECIQVTLNIEDTAGHSLTSPHWDFETDVSSSQVWRTPKAVLSEESFWPPANLIDDHMETGNLTAPFASHWVIYDLGESYQVNQIRLSLAALDPRMWSIYVSDDINVWGDPVKKDWPAEINFSEEQSIIVDNNENSFEGGWPSGSSPLGFHGIDFQTHITVTGQADASCTWRPLVPANGHYHVFVRWASYPNAATDASYTINYSGGSETLYLNQQINDSKWNLLGNYYFTQGTSGTIVLSNLSATAGTYAVADAVQLVQKDVLPAWVSTTVTSKEGRFLKLFIGRGPIDKDMVREIDFSETLP